MAKSSGKFFDNEKMCERLAELDPVKVADELSRLEPPRQAQLFRRLDKDRAQAVFQHLDAAHQECLLEDLDEQQSAELLENLDPDDRAQLFEELPAAVSERLLNSLSPHERLLTQQLLAYPVESAGRIMSPEFVALRSDSSVREALDLVRRQGAEAETVHTLPVTDENRKLIGLAELSALVLAEAEQKVATVMQRELRAVRTDDDQETVARLLQAADLLAVPVVDAEGRLLGLVTVDDAMDVLTREEEEDMSRAGGTEPLRRPYFAVSDLHLVRSRIVWLLVLITAASLTVQVLNVFEESLDRVVALAMFIPLLIGTGGNAGAQSSTTVVRGMAVGDLHPSDLLRTMLRESRVGLLLGLVLGAASYLPVWLFGGNQLALVICLSLISICTLAALVGAAMPLMAQKFGIDPAVASTPLVTSVIDTSGLVIYFLIAQAVFSP